MRYHPPSIFFPGTIICKSYEVVRFLGMGGSGMVYLCRHKELNNHQVAMKVLSVESDEQVERFKREILATYKVNHTNVIRPYELVTSRNLLAFTMEYAGGESLADRIAREGQLPIKQVVDILLAICSGLNAIHEAGIVHRDLKPGNILSSSEGNIKITDFGIARVERTSGASPKGTLGTVEYVSPEFIEYGVVDSRSDLYSLGILAYEMISGKVPFYSDAPARTLVMHLNDKPINLQSLRKDCPMLLARIVEKAMTKKAFGRYQSALEMIEDLEKLRLILLKKNVVEAKPKVEEKSLIRSIAKQKSKAQVNGVGLAFRKAHRNNFPQIFAAGSLLVWLATVGAWLYYGQSTSLISSKSAAPINFNHPKRF